MPAGHVTDQDRAHVRQLHAAGKGRNEIARETGLSAGTVSGIAENLGLSFDRSTVIAATEARKADNAARRAALVSRCYQRAEQILTRLEADSFRTLVKGEYGRESPDDLDFVPPQEEKALAQALGTHLANAARLEQVDGDGGLDQAKSVIGSLADGLAAVAAALPPADA